METIIQFMVSVAYPLYLITQFLIFYIQIYRFLVYNFSLIVQYLVFIVKVCFINSVQHIPDADSSLENGENRRKKGYTSVLRLTCEICVIKRCSLSLDLMSSYWPYSIS